MSDVTLLFDGEKMYCAGFYFSGDKYISSDICLSRICHKGRLFISVYFLFFLLRKNLYFKPLLKGEVLRRSGGVFSPIYSAFFLFYFSTQKPLFNRLFSLLSSIVQLK